MTRYDKGDFFSIIQKWNDFIHSEEIKYEDAIVGIIDILAFRSLLKEYGENAPRQIAEMFANQMMFTESSYKNLQFKILSDTLIVFGKDDHAITALNVINVIELFSLSLLKNGYLTRGAIVSGKHFIRDDIMVSPAFIKAYEIEQNLCIYPRIIIEKQIKQVIFNQCLKSSENLDGILSEGFFRIVNKENFRIDFDGFIVIDNLINYPSIYLLTYGKSNIDGSTLAEINLNDIINGSHIELNVIKIGIQKALERTNNEKERMKVEYLINIYNKTINNMKYDYRKDECLI